MDVKVRRATFEDQERIWNFLQAAYEDRAQYKFPARWLWEFVDNPFLDGDSLPIWIAEVDGKIIGQLCEMIVPFKLGDRIYLVPWGVDFIVLPEYRGRWVGALLLKGLREYHDIIIGLSMAPVSRKLAEYLGGDDVEGGVELSKTLRFDTDQALDAIDARLGEANGFAKMCGRLHLGWIVASALNLRMRLRDSRRLHRKEPSLTIEKFERFGEEIDQLWERLAPHFPVIVQRNAEYLNWKFVEQPHVQYEKFVARQRGVVRGYVITRKGVPPEPSMGIIADVFAAPEDDDVLQALLVHATKHLKLGGVETIIAASSVPSYIAQYSRLGFKETQQVTPMFQCRDAAGHSLVSNPRNWFLSMGDHDWDQYPLL